MVVLIILVIMAILSISFPSANAYIDPGTGKLIVGGPITSFFILIGAIITGILTRYLWNPIKKLFKRLWKKN